MTQLVRVILAWFIPALVLAGCAAVEKSGGEPPPRAVSMFHKNGARATWPGLVAAATGADAVLIGENHGHPLGLSSAAALFKDALAQAPAATLAMEFFERDDQKALDDYLAGLTDDDAFRAAARRTSGNYPAGHAQMVEASKEAKRPVVAANAPRIYVRLSRKEGYDRLRALTEEQKRTFRIPDALPTGKYREAFDKVMGGNDEKETPEAKSERLDSVFRSQSLWDWTMAESVSREMARGGKPTVLVVGRFHVDHEGGTALALRHLSPDAKVVTVSFVDEWSTSLREEDKGRADFVLYVGPAPGSPGSANHDAGIRGPQEVGGRWTWRD